MTFPTQFVSQSVTIGSTNIHHPIYTFKVNLDRLLSESIGPNTNSRSVTVLHPDMYQSNPDTGRANAAQHAAYTTSWIPGYLRGENVVVNDNGTITAYGQKAVYLKKTFADVANPLLTLTDIAPYDFITEFGTFNQVGSGGGLGGGTGAFKLNGVTFT